jgi:hypothetical protein
VTLKHASTDAAAAAAGAGVIGLIDAALGLAWADAHGELGQAVEALAFGAALFAAAFGVMAWWYTRRGLREALPVPPGVMVESPRRTTTVQFLGVAWFFAVVSLLASADPTFLPGIGGSFIGGAVAILLQRVWIVRRERKTGTPVLREKLTWKGARTLAPLRYFVAAEDRSTAGGRVQNGGLTQSI